MKKSDIYKMAQEAVLTANYLTAEAKLAILRELMSKEDLEIFKENGGIENDVDR